MINGAIKKMKIFTQDEIDEILTKPSPKRKIPKITLTRYGSKGWEFSIYNELLNEVNYYRTNGAGEGLWWEDHGIYRQIGGTCSYELPKNRQKAYRRLYYEYFEPREW